MIRTENGKKGTRNTKENLKHPSREEFRLFHWCWKGRVEHCSATRRSKALLSKELVETRRGKRKRAKGQEKERAWHARHMFPYQAGAKRCIGRSTRHREEKDLGVMYIGTNIWYNSRVTNGRINSRRYFQSRIARSLFTRYLLFLSPPERILSHERNVQRCNVQSRANVTRTLTASSVAYNADEDLHKNRSLRHKRPDKRDALHEIPFITYLFMQNKNRTEIFQDTLASTPG